MTTTYTFVNATAARLFAEYWNHPGRCEWMLKTGEGAGKSDLLCESNMLSVIGEYLNGVRCGWELCNDRVASEDCHT